VTQGSSHSIYIRGGVTATISPPTAPNIGVAPRRRLYRHRSDIARLIVNLILLGCFVVIGTVASAGVRTVAVDVLRLFDTLPRSLVEGLVGVVQLLALVLPVVVVLVLVRGRQFALLGILVLAAVISAAAMALLSGVVQDSVPVEEIEFERFTSWFIGGEFPSSTYLAGMTAVFVAGSPWLLKRWRRAGWIFIAAAVLARMLSATEVPLRLGMMLTLGAASGSLALVIFGAPRRRVDQASVTATLFDAGIAVDDLEPLGDGAGTPTFSGLDADDRRWFVKVLGRDERDTDFLISLWRLLSLRGLGDDVVRGTPERLVEHEALAMSIFAAAGVRVPSAFAIVNTPEELSVLVSSFVDGPVLGSLEPSAITDELLGAIWSDVAVLQERRLAHRRLNPSNVRVTPAGATLIDLRFADLNATDEVLGADVAELLASTASLVGPDRALAAASAALDQSQLARAVPLLQHAVLTPATRAGYKSDKKALDALRDATAAAAGIDQIQLAPVSRLTIKGVVSLVGSMVLGYYIISLATNWQDIWESFRSADIWYVVPVTILALATAFTGALSLLGAVTTKLSFLRTTAVMYAQSFLNRFTPANAGGMAMRMRYLQLNGQDTTVAAAAVGLTSAASGIVQGILIVVFFIWGGTTDSFEDFSMPDVGTILIIVLVVGLIATGILFTHWGRTVIRPWIGDAIGKIRGTFGELARDPSKMAMLFGGALLGKMCNIFAFYLSCLAFDVDISFAKAGALFMVANTVGSAVPSPGGVGGIEAALTAVLIGFGVDSATAAAIVLFYRILTFWLPTLPGYGFLQYTQRKGIV
jgi:uncharacterized protein (TIRG00374 family)